VYEHSRALFRALKPFLVQDSAHPGLRHRRLLRVCEEAVERMAEDARLTPSPARHVFRRVRTLIRAQDQLRAYAAIERELREAAEWFAAERREHGPNLRRCAALNRRGQPCEREPLRGGRYCPSHAPRFQEAS
jgi:hypothetical protein